MFSLAARVEKSLFPMIVKHQKQSHRSGYMNVASAISSRYFSDEGPKQRVVKVKKKKKESKAGENARSRDLQLLLAFLDAPKIKPPPADEQETIRRELIQKNYTIGKFKQHNEDNHDIACKLRMKKHAISMLPKLTVLKEKALEVDDSLPPRWRTIPAWTPPIPDFNSSDYMTIEE